MLEQVVTWSLMLLVALATWAALRLQRRLFPPRPRAYRCTLAVVVPEPAPPVAAPLRRSRERRCRPDRRSHPVHALPGKLQAIR